MIIGFVGLAGSGKGTAGEYLCEKYDFLSESFAKPVKDAVAAIFNWPRELLEGDTDESRVWRGTEDEFWTAHFGTKITPRIILQRFGTDVMRQHMLSDIWILSLLHRMNKKEDYVITDVRFENEIESIHLMGGKIVYIERVREPWQDDAVNAKWLIKRGLASGQHHLNEFNNALSKTLPPIHRSEWDWVDQEFDYEIKNDSDILTFKKKLDDMIETFKTAK